MSGSIDVDNRAFLAELPAAFEEWRVQAEAFVDVTADKVVDRARELVPKRTGRLAESIHRGSLVRTPNGASVTVSAGGPGIRETIFVEFGTTEMRAQPYMRPALAMAAGAARGSLFEARVTATSKTRAAARRAAHRQRLRRAVRKGFLTSEQARRESRRISSARRLRG